jgi:Alkylmercury lyase
VTGDGPGDRPRPVVGVVGTRIRDLSPAARSVHRTILRWFATTGRAPDPAALADVVPGGHHVQVVLGELHDRDVVRLDGQGRIRAAYPFSAVPTAHQVATAGGPTVYAMCAIDALGIADMLSVDVAITSVDPVSGEQIRVAVVDGRAGWHPESAVVVDGAEATGDGGCPPDEVGSGVRAAADRCCAMMNFFTSPATAHAWLAGHPRVSGTVLSREQARRIGVDIFGHLLDD